jgi:hypothetical protein
VSGATPRPKRLLHRRGAVAVRPHLGLRHLVMLGLGLPPRLKGVPAARDAQRLLGVLPGLVAAQACQEVEEKRPLGVEGGGNLGGGRHGLLGPVQRCASALEASRAASAMKRDSEGTLVYVRWHSSAPQH